jgi:hypothetical protein
MTKLTRSSNSSNRKLEGGNTTTSGRSTEYDGGLEAWTDLG